jgi:hypothetical protein
MPSLRLRACLSVIALLAGFSLACVGQIVSDPTKETPREQSNDPRGTCLSLAQAALRPNLELCVKAHVYDVIELPDGTRFLDVCPPSTADSDCGFTIISRPADRAEVGDLGKFRNQDVRIRGIVRLTHGRMGLTLSHARQFHGGPEKFRPNPLLVRDFDGQSKRMPVKDPNLSSSGHHRTFMNNRDQEPIPSGR